jgi:hypothetical protein
VERSRFDAFSKRFARRSLMRPDPTSIVRAAAQDVTPASGNRRDPSLLFVQSFQSGSIDRKDGTDDQYTLTLADGGGQTVYFSDRPGRVVGSQPTAEFLERLGFADGNPPNAALVVETSPGESDVAVVELFNPIYDPISEGVTYDIVVLQNWQAELEVSLQEAPIDLAALAPSFGAARLFIDSGLNCPDKGQISCAQASTGAVVGQIGYWDFDGWCGWGSDDKSLGYCLPCQPRPQSQHGSPGGELDPGQPGDYRNVWLEWGDICNQRFAECNGECVPNNWCQADPWAQIPCPNHSL